MSDNLIRVLLVEDEKTAAVAIQKMLQTRPNVSVTAVSNADDALRLMLPPGSFDALISDIRLGGMSGVDLLRRVRETAPDFPVILITGFDSLDTAVQAVKLGAQDYILKPFKSPEVLLGPLEKAVREYRLVLRNRVLQSELILAEERERRRLASDLHDSLAQSLIMSDIQLKSLAGEINDKKLSSRLNDVSELLKQAIRQTRQMISDLSPPSLYELGLEAALSHLSEQIQIRHGIRVEFKDDGNSKALNEESRVLLFRAVRELLVNVVKHSRATEASVSVSRDRNTVRISVEDNGVGFDDEASPSSSPAGGFGLISIRQRLQDLGGELQIVSRPGHGVRAILVAPVESANSFS